MTELNILTTHIDPLPGTPAYHINALLPGEQQADMLRESVLKLEPNAKFHFIHKRAKNERHHNCINKNNELHANLTLNILRLQRDFLKAAENNSDWIICDPDFLFFKSPRPVFEKNFQVALTKRKNKIMPYNSGIIFIRNLNENTAFNFFDEKVKIIEKKFSEHSNWFADQAVLKEIIDRSEFQESQGIYCYKKYYIKLLDGCEYNYSPPRDHPYLFIKPDVTAFHFKGRCRSYMKEYYRSYISKQDPGILRSIRKLTQSIYLEYQRSIQKELFLSAKERIIPEKF